MIWLESGHLQNNRWKVLRRGLASLRKMGLEAIGLGSQSGVAVLREVNRNPNSQPTRSARGPALGCNGPMNTKLRIWPILGGVRQG